MTALAGITELLRRMASPGTFATRFNAAASALSIRVDGVGKLRLPITVATARWRGPLAAHLTRIRRSLGLPSGAVLRAEVHSLLVYGPGQHFKPHRDSEKSDRMIGTLVVNLPSSFSGGSIEIRHGEQVLRVAGSARELTLIAFYADCVHEVLPVKKGYRVVLTFNLILDAKRGAEAARVPAKHACAGKETISVPRQAFNFSSAYSDSSTMRSSKCSGEAPAKLRITNSFTYSRTR